MEDRNGLAPMDTDRETLKSGKFMLRTLILLVEDETAIR